MVKTPLRGSSEENEGWAVTFKAWHEAVRDDARQREDSLWRYLLLAYLECGGLPAPSGN